MADAEHQHQSALFAWARSMENTFPELAYLHAIPNAAKRSYRVANRMKAEGLRSGVFDINLDVARGGYHGIKIEMKRPKARGQPKGKMTMDQERWKEFYIQQGYVAVVCYGWESARDELLKYLRIPCDKVVDNSIDSS